MPSEIKGCVTNRLTVRSGFCLCLLLSWSPLLYAELYRWTDEKGKEHFSDQPRDAVEQGSISNKLQPADSSTRPPVALPQADPSKPAVKAVAAPPVPVTPVNPLYQQYKPAAFDATAPAKQLDRSCQEERERLSRAYEQDLIEKCESSAANREEKARCTSEHLGAASSCMKYASGSGTKCENKFDEIPVCKAARENSAK